MKNNIKILQLRGMNAFSNVRSAIAPVWIKFNTNFVQAYLLPLLNHVRTLSVYGVTWASKILHVRHRYMFTRHNKIRLRYVASAFCVVMASGIFALTLSQNSHQVQAQAYPSNLELAQQAGDEAENSLSKMLDTRLYGRFSLASASMRSIPQPKKEMIKIKSGDALSVVLEEKGIGAGEAREMIKVLSDHYDPRRIRVGQEIELNFDPNKNGDYEFVSMNMALGPLKSVSVTRNGGGFQSHLDEKEVSKVANAGAATIQTSVFGSAGKAGIPKGVTADLIRIYSWDVDFQRDIRSGDKIEVLYDAFQTVGGYVAKTGDIRYAKLTIGGVEKPIYRFKMADGRVDYFGRDGISIKRTLMKTPIDGARMSSGYGMRRHPILGYNKMHKGMDFAAPTGTPIYAAGDGVVETAGRKGAYGHYIRIRHNSKLKTAYAHLSKYKKGISAGKRVKQGQVIGYVGSTGRSTGPHLHYEVLKNGKQVNPRSVNLPTGEELTGKQLAKFKAMVKQIDREYMNVQRDMKFARKKNEDSKRFN